jgi:hypothetical protein
MSALKCPLPVINTTRASAGKRFMASTMASASVASRARWASAIGASMGAGSAPQ